MLTRHHTYQASRLKSAKRALGGEGSRRNKARPCNRKSLKVSKELTPTATQAVETPEGSPEKPLWRRD